MRSIRRTVTIALIIVARVVAGAGHAAAQHPGVWTAHHGASVPIFYGRHDWAVDTRPNDGDLRRVTYHSGVFARDGAYYPFRDHVDDGSVRHVDRYFADGRGGWYHPRGFISTNRGQYRGCACWTHSTTTLFRIAFFRCSLGANPRILLILRLACTSTAAISASACQETALDHARLCSPSLKGKLPSNACELLSTDGWDAQQCGLPTAAAEDTAQKPQNRP